MYQIIVLLPFLLLLNSCNPKHSDSEILKNPTKKFSENIHFEYKGTTKMIALLKEVVSNISPLEMRYNFNKKKCLIIGEYFLKNKNKNAMDVYLYANELLLAGETETTIDMLEKLHDELQKGKIKRGPLDDDKLNSLRALAYVRLGEKNNCISSHCNESCVFPLHGKGMHNQKVGMSKAKEILLETLKKHPDDLESIWL